jgi:hypothetical protein
MNLFDSMTELDWVGVATTYDQPHLKAVPIGLSEAIRFDATNIMRILNELGKGGLVINTNMLLDPVPPQGWSWWQIEWGNGIRRTKSHHGKIVECLGMGALFIRSADNVIAGTIFRQFPDHVEVGERIRYEVKDHKFYDQFEFGFFSDPGTIESQNAIVAQVLNELFPVWLCMGLVNQPATNGQIEWNKEEAPTIKLAVDRNMVLQRLKNGGAA